MRKLLRQERSGHIHFQVNPEYSDSAVRLDFYIWQRVFGSRVVSYFYVLRTQWEERSTCLTFDHAPRFRLRFKRLTMTRYFFGMIMEMHEQRGGCCSVHEYGD
jgi:hypothetical protein